MSAKNMLIIKDASGNIIAAHVEDPPDAVRKTFISPADPQHTLHKVADVPAEIYDLADPEQFGKAITAHVASADAKVTATSAEEVYASLARPAG